MGFYTLFYVFHIIKLIYIQAIMGEDVKYSMSYYILNDFLIDWIVVIGYMSLIAMSTKRLIIKKISWRKIFFLHIVLSLTIGLVIRVMINFQNIITGVTHIWELSIMENLNNFMYVLDLNFLIYFAMVFIIYTFYYVHQVKKEEERRGELESQLVKTRMKMLSSQLQPHFLFNTLNSISSLIEINPKSARDTIADLSDFLREILYNSDEKFITLEKELGVLEYYLKIVKLRFSDHLTIVEDIDPKLLPCKIPAIILQPIIENSIKYGYSYNHTKLTIKISAYCEKDFIVFKVENNGNLLTDNFSALLTKGLGLSNLNERLLNLYENKHIISMNNKPDGSGVETLIKLPFNCPGMVA
ncbi:MAG: histidine kinase [Gillisia sp.]|nr:histidine kinase [Gillisia sp.]